MVGTCHFLQELLADYTLVCCAIGGTGIDEWQKDGVLYSQCLAAIEQAGNPVTAIFHFQGERETANRKRAHAWLSLTKTFVRSLRRDIAIWNAGNQREVQFIYAQLGSYPGDFDRPYWRYIQNAGAKLQTRIPNAHMIQTFDITPYCDKPHWCEAGYREIASRYFYKFMETERK